MVPRQGRPLQTWKSFLRNHAEGIASIDLFVVPTVTFEQLFAFLVLGHDCKIARNLDPASKVFQRIDLVGKDWN